MIILKILNKYKNNYMKKKIIINKNNHLNIRIKTFSNN
jgi:hypothetical protein